MKDKLVTFIATGRRKAAHARVRLYPGGTGKIIVNGDDYKNYFFDKGYQLFVLEPLQVTEVSSKVDVKAKIEGGGFAGQAGALRLGISRALVKYNEELKSVLRKNGLLTRDPREKERKKYGQKGARKQFQWTKR